MESDKVYIMTPYEILFLIQDGETPGAELCRRRLVEQFGEMSAPVVNAGAATLYARESIAITGDEVATIGPASGVAFILRSAQCWVDVTLLSHEIQQTHALINSGSEVLALSGAPFGCFSVEILVSEDSFGSLPASIVESFFTTEPPAKAVIIAWGANSRSALTITFDDQGFSSEFVREGDLQSSQMLIAGDKFDDVAKQVSCLVDHLGSSTESAETKCSTWPCT